MATLLFALHDELLLVLGFLTDHEIARTACTCIVLRKKTDETSLRCIAACELGQGLLQHVRNGCPIRPSRTNELPWVLDAPNDAQGDDTVSKSEQGKSVCRNWAFPMASHSKWWSFLRGLSKVAGRTTASDEKCARSIHKFNVVARTIRINAFRLYDGCEEFGLPSPDDDFMHRIAPAHGFASVKKVLMENQLLARLVDPSGLMSTTRHGGRIGVGQCGSGQHWFCAGHRVLGVWYPWN